MAEQFRGRHVKGKMTAVGMRKSFFFGAYIYPRKMPLIHVNQDYDDLPFHAAAFVQYNAVAKCAFLKDNRATMFEAVCRSQLMPCVHVHSAVIDRRNVRIRKKLLSRQLWAPVW